VKRLVNEARRVAQHQVAGSYDRLWAACLEIELQSELHVTRIDSAPDRPEIARTNG